jgi:glycosyltransferase involved in cell wall biosynthesis
MSDIGILAVSEPQFGGTFQYTLSMIEALRLIPEHRYTLFTTNANHWYDNLGLPIKRLPGTLNVLGDVIARQLKSKTSFGLFSEVEKVIAPIYSAYLLASSRPFAFTLHDLQEEYYPQYLSYKQRAWRFVINRLLARAAVRIICESTNVKADIQRFLRVEPGRISVIPAPPVSQFSGESSDPEQLNNVRQRLSLPEQYLFYPAQFNPHKNHARLIAAFALVARKFPNCHLLLTGEKRLEFSRVMSKVQELGLASRVKHLGQIDVSDLVATYKLATIVVVPTLFESISIPIYEAFSVGVPVCASGILALPEQAGNAAILFDPSSADDMANKIVATLDDADLRAKLVERGTERIHAMSIDKYAANLRRILDEVPGRRS